MSRARLLLPALLSLLPAPAAGQGFPPSQRTHITQNVALTKVELEYGRPVARGRTLWGALVPWDSVWHPGADSATRVTFDRDVTIGGRPVPRGTYSLWLIPRASGSWTFMLNRDAFVDHKSYGGAARDVVRLEVRADSLSHMESMFIGFPMVLRDEATLRVHWGSRAIDVPVKAPWRPE